MMTRFYCSVSQCAPKSRAFNGFASQEQWVLANAKKEKRTGVKNIADHLVPLGYRLLIWKETLWLGYRKD